MLCLQGMSQCYAQSHADSTHELKRVKVSTTHVLPVLAPVQRMDAAVIERLNTQSVADAIRYFSGVQLKDYGGVGGLKTVNVRSMGTNHLGVFYDGIQLGNAQNGQVDLGRYSLDNMEQIDLYNGQRSELLQSAKDYGSASAIYLQTAVPRFKEGQRTNIRAAFKTGSFGLINPSVTWEQRLTPKLSSSFNTEWTHANGRYKFRYKRANEDGSIAYDTTATRENGDIEAIRVEGGLNGTVKGGEWKMKAYSYFSERGLPGFIANNLFTHGQRQWDRNVFLQSSYRRKVNEHYSFLINGKFAYDYTRYLDTDTASKYTDNTYKQKELYVSIANEYVLTSFWRISLSGDYQWNQLDANLVNFAYPVRHTGLVALASSFRFDRLKVQGSLLTTLVKDHVKIAEPAPAKTEYTPAVLASWQPFKTQDLYVRAFYKRIFRMPTFNDLYYTFIGNSLLKPEFATQYDAGATYTKIFTHTALQQISLQADAYYNTVTDKIVAVPTANPFRWQMLNLGKVHIKGVDVAAQSSWLVHKAIMLTTRLSYTFQEARDYTDPTDSFYGDQIPYSPRNSFSVILNADYKKWSLNYSYIYTGDRYDQKANIPKNYVQPWYTSDLALSRYIDCRLTKLRVGAEVNNVFNQYYDVVLNYPMPGRNYKLIVNITL